MFDAVAAAALIALARPQSPVDVSVCHYDQSQGWTNDYTHGPCLFVDTNVIEEDEPGWSCADMGNRICGPNNSEGVTPGDYSQR